MIVPVESSRWFDSDEAAAGSCSSLPIMTIVRGSITDKWQSE